MAASTRRTKLRPSHPRFAACAVVTMSLVLCAGAVAAPSPGSKRSAHPHRPPTSVSPRQRQQLLARHQGAEALLLSVRGHRIPRVAGHQASGAPFQRGDVFAVSSAGIQEYSPTGQLIQTVAGSSGSGGGCFNPDGTRLIVPGVGLFNRFGNQLPSNWAAVTNPGRCVADGFGSVYMDTTSGVSYSITKYDTTGDPLQTFNITDPETHHLAFDVAPDECTIYYGSYDPGVSVISRLNACTDTLGSPFNSSSFVDDLKVLPNWQVLNGDDGGAYLFDASGQSVVQNYYPADFFSDTPTTLALDPDGASLWECCQLAVSGGVFTPYIFRFDINTGQQLASWPMAAALVGVYGPPLLGDAHVQANVDSNAAGTAQAFPTRVDYSGPLTRLHLYVDSSSTANHVVVGIYSNHLGRPGELLERGTIANVRAGSWNYVDVPPMRVSAGQLYWVAVLGPQGGGTAAFRDRRLEGLAMVSARHNLTDLPTRWSGERRMLSGSLSAYGS
jgi:hypothetical protein